jgi:hypothetical protein
MDKFPRTDIDYVDQYHSTAEDMGADVPEGAMVSVATKRRGPGVRPRLMASHTLVSVLQRMLYTPPKGQCGNDQRRE